MADIYWSPLCGQNTQQWAFWSTSVSFETFDPDFTLCFQYTILHWIPCFFLWLCAPFHVYHLRRRETRFNGKVSQFCVIKTITTIFMAFIMSLDFFKTISDDVTNQKPAPILYLYPIIMIISLCLTAYLTILEYKKGIASSAQLSLFWWFLFFISICILRSKIRYLTQNVPGISSDNNFREVTWIIFFIMVTVQLVFSFFADASSLDMAYSLGTKLPASHKESEKLSLLKNSDNKRYAYQAVSDSEFNDKHNSIPKDIMPEYYASFLSIITFSWITGLIVRGYKRAITSMDLWELLPEDRTHFIITRMKQIWKTCEEKCHVKNNTGISFTNMNHPSNNESYQKLEFKSVPIDDKTKKKKQPSFFNVMTSYFGFEYAISGVWKLIYDLLSFAQPQLLSLFITFIDSGDAYSWHGYFYGTMLFVTAMIRTIVVQKYYWHTCYVVGMRLRTGIIAMVYRKSLQMSGASRKETTVGEIVNLMSVDAQKFQEAPVYLHGLWNAPVTIAIALYFLWQQLGPSVLSGLAVMILLVPFNGYMAGKTRKLQIAQMRLKDQRIKVISEVLNGMKVLKLYGWEKSFQLQIENIREKEISLLRTAAYLNAISSISWFCAPFLIALSSFAVYVLSDPNNVLNANKAFVSLSLFNIMNFPMSMLPATIAFLVQGAVSLKRINKFLNQENIESDQVIRNSGNGNSIEIEHGTFRWTADDVDILKNINFKIPKGQLVAVVGNVGSGKSSLIAALLGELHKRKGKIFVSGSVAYVPQQAWCQNCTLKENILFGRACNEKRYETVLEACALKPDLKVLPGGDQTEIGEKGINLSGGQKQRISLARAVYQDTDVYLLDDPLSAVDSHVGKHLFDKVIGNDGLLANKTRLLITHNLSILPKVDYIITLKDGEISEHGSYVQLLKHNGTFAEFCQTYLNELDKSDDENEDQLDAETEATIMALKRTISVLSGTEMSESENERPTRVRSRRSSNRKLSRRQSELEELQTEQKRVEKQKQLIEEEKSETGNVRLSVFATYCRSLSWSMVFLTAITYLLYVASATGTNVWLSIWSEDKPTMNKSSDMALRDLRLGVYGALGFSQTIFVLLENCAVAVGTYRASKVLHNQMLSAIMRAPMQFFDTTPLGRVLNRFSKDVDTVDVNIPLTIKIWLITLAGVCGTIIIISISTPVFLLAMVPLLVFYYFVQRFYISTSRQLKRIDSVKRSPIYSHFQESVIGAQSIRAYRRQEDFINKSDRLVDENQMAWYPNIVSNRWLAIYLETIGNFVILFAAVFAVLQKDTLTSGIAALSVTYSLQITGSLNFMVRMTSDLETQVVSVERIEEYTLLTSEAPWEIHRNKPPSNWPSLGKVEFHNYSVRYRSELDLVLKNISASITPAEKVGIVGRTGAGKSSLTLALFRLLEPAGGSISIDGVDINGLGLHDLRKCLTIIPQEPVLFSGTLRMNLDPFDEHSDSKIWKVLEQAHLKSFVESQTAGLLFKCAEGGENMSVGQRQLVCLARALLRHSKILVLDEATAAVDVETDELIQATIRKEFVNSTVITIAHRLNTIIDYDRIMVLDRGSLKEYDSPKNLLSNSKSIFYGMAKDAGLV